MDGELPHVTESVTYDVETETYRAQFHSPLVRPTTAVVRALGHVRDVDPTDLDPLYDAIEPEALDVLVTHAADRTDVDGDLTVEFTYLGHRVAVTSARVLEVRLESS